MPKLSPKQQRFVDEYLIDLNATQAAIRAGYSAKTANEQAARLLANVSIQQALQARMKAREARTEITQNKVLSDIEAIKLDAMQKVADRDGNLVMVNHVSALKAAELQGKHLGMFKDKVELTGKNGGAIQMEQSIAVTPAELEQIARRLNDEV